MTEIKEQKETRIPLIEKRNTGGMGDTSLMGGGKRVVESNVSTKAPECCLSWLENIDIFLALRINRRSLEFFSPTPVQIAY